MSTHKTPFLIILLVKSFAALCSAAQPNILLIVSEDNGPEVGCYGDQYAKTPHLDRLADQGIRFDRAYVPQAGCSQSRASFRHSAIPRQQWEGLATPRVSIFNCRAQAEGRRARRARVAARSGRRGLEQKVRSTN